MTRHAYICTVEMINDKCKKLLINIPILACIIKSLRASILGDGTLGVDLGDRARGPF